MKNFKKAEKSHALSDFLRRGGESGRLLRAYDWSITSLEKSETWLQSLRTIIRLMLYTNHSAFIFWGDDSNLVYNDANRTTKGFERRLSATSVKGRGAMVSFCGHVAIYIALLTVVLLMMERSSNQLSYLYSIYK